MDNPKRDPQNSITGAVILIFIGIIFLLRQFDIVVIHNWWALFILIPAISSLSTLVKDLRAGTNALRVISQGVLGALFPTAIALMFLFNLDWVKYWPMFVILAGFSMILTGFLPSTGGLENIIKSIQPWLITWGLGVCIAGAIFFNQTLGIVQIDLPSTTLLGFPILVAASGGLIVALQAYQKSAMLKAGINIIAAVTLALPGIFAVLGVQANLILPLLIIAAGIVLVISFIGGQNK